MKRLSVIFAVYILFASVGCKKAKSEKLLSSHTHKLNKAWTWDGNIIRHYSGDSPEEINFKDSIVIVEVKYDATIRFAGNEMSHINKSFSDQGIQIDVDEKNWLTYMTYSKPGNYAYLKFFYKVDSVFFYSQVQSPGANIRETFYSKN